MVIDCTTQNTPTHDVAQDNLSSNNFFVNGMKTWGDEVYDLKGL